MTTALELVNETREHLLSGTREPINRMNGTLTTGQTTFALKYDLGPIVAGTVISVDLERIRIWEVDAATKTVLVAERAVESTAAATHADLAEVRVNSRFDSFKILRALNEDIKAISSPNVGLWQMLAVDLTVVSGQTGYDLTDTKFIDVYRVQMETSNPIDKDWPEIWSWSYVHGANATDFPTGQAILIYEGGIPGKKYRVWYRAKLGLLTTLADIVETATGLSAEAARIPVLGAIAQLAPVREIKRTFTESQGEPRRAEEVPPGASFQAGRGMAAIRKERLIAESARLRAKFPPRKKIYG